MKARVYHNGNDVFIAWKPEGFIPFSRGFALLRCRAAPFLAILLTGYVGGAVATHVRAGGGLFEILFPVIFATIIWGGIFLRDSRLGALILLRRMS
jgi:hypothetical protein